jgi:hypothetical protein
MERNKALVSALLLGCILLLGSSTGFSMASAPSSQIIDIIEHTGTIKITKPYGGTITVGPYEEIPSFIPVGSRVEVISGIAEVMIGEDSITLESGEMVYIWGDEMTGSVEFSIVPLEPEALVEPAEAIVEEASPSSP